ncbi:unnamed protein product [Adineta ricciae]|uniref:Uncharacterized protein n=1 Tax=Adineta ricciae TaxID=249248 RepID=A0A814KKM3_ADIRI|nr:unnamed protein product [Adineta ricciae]
MKAKQNQQDNEPSTTDSSITISTKVNTASNIPLPKQQQSKDKNEATNQSNKRPRASNSPQDETTKKNNNKELRSSDIDDSDMPH